MSELGQTEKSARLNGMSVLPPTADVVGSAPCPGCANFGSDLISFYHLIGPSTDRSGRFSQSAALPPS